MKCRISSKNVSVNKKGFVLYTSENIKNIIEMIALSARTAPKAGGQDFIVIQKLFDKEV